MVKAHLDESHVGHERAKRGEPWTSSEKIREEEEEELKREQEEEEEESEDEESEEEEEEGGYYSGKRTTRGDTKPSSRKKFKANVRVVKAPRRREIEIKDPNKPKGPQGPYMCFVSHNREKIIKEFPGIKFGEVGKKLGQRWSNLSEKGKEMYNEMAEKDKERYRKEMEKYVPMSDTELNKLKAKAEKEKQEKSEKSGFKKPYKCSERLKTFLNGQETISRAQLTSEMWKYFKEKNLMDPENKQFVVSDDKLFKLIGERRFKAFGFAKYLSKDLIPIEEEEEEEKERERERDA
jgi:chromatin remodeling complex protein RSC6